MMQVPWWKDRWFWAVLAAGLGIRLIMAIPVIKNPDLSALAYGDAIGYHRLGLNLAQGHGFSIYPDPPFSPDAFRTPGFPGMLALLYWLFGPNPAWAILFNCLVSGLSVGLVYLMAKHWWQKSAPVAGLLFAFNPLSLVYAPQIMTETSFTFLVLLGFGLVLLRPEPLVWRARTGVSRLLYKGWPRLWSFVGGLVVGLATLVRPVGLVSLPVVLVGSGKRWLLSLVGFAIPVLGWVIRNQLVFGIPFVSTVSWVNLAYYNAGAVLSAQEGITLRQADIRVFNTTSKRFGWGVKAVDEADIWAFEEDPVRWRQMAQVGLGIILRNPGTYALEHTKGLLGALAPVHPYRLPAVYGINPFLQGRRVGSGPEVLSAVAKQGPIAVIREMFQGLPWWAGAFWALSWLYQIALFWLAGMGIWRNKGSGTVWVLFAAAVVLFVVAGPMAVPRMRHTTDALLCVLAGGALAKMGITKAYVWTRYRRAFK